jgi:hypothetical protein
MSLVNPLPKPQPITKDQAKAKYASLVNITMSSLLRQIASGFDRVYDQTWKNTDGLTPQEAFDALGKDAVQLILISNTFQQSINSIMPETLDYSVPSGLEMKVNPDGTVQVIDKV